MRGAAPARVGNWGETLSLWLDRAVMAALVLGLGVVLGIQYMSPDKRVLSVLAALVVAGVAWRLEIVAGIGMVLFALPFPKGTTFGTTNIALILLLVVIYLLRVGQRALPRPRGTSLNMPLLGLLLAYVVSFKNVQPVDLQAAISSFQVFLGTVFLFAVVVNCVRSEADLRRLHNFQVITIVLISLVALWELTNPGRALVPGWIDFTTTTGEVFNTRDVRIGGTFHDYELLADFSGLNIILLTFLLMQTKETNRRVLLGALLAVTVLIMFSTVTRGPIVSLAVALAYLLWMIRRHVRVVPLVMFGALIAGSLAAANFLVTHFTRSGDLFYRLMRTEIRGFTPDTRAAAWESAWEHFLLNPVFGCGPFYSAKRGLATWFWPHNLYLYVANIVGIVGLAFFLWMLWKLFALTRPRVDTPAGGSYVESYLLMARVQLVFFLVDQFKIEYLRNNTYQYQVWMMFALWVAADRLRREGTGPATRLAT